MPRAVPLSRGTLLPQAAGLLTASLLSVFTAGCGYVGEPLPPALRRPVPVTDLAAVEQGPKIVITFTVPTTTTENLAIKGEPDMDLRVGTVEGAFEPNSWAQTAQRIAPLTVNNKQARAELDAAKFNGQHLAIGVNVHGPGGRSAGWSNFVGLDVTAPLATPQRLEARDGRDAVDLSWQGSAPEFRIFRRPPGASAWLRIGIADTAHYSDATIEYGQEYEYFVQAQQKSGETYAESETSAVVRIKPADHFPPATPTGVTAVPGTRTIELIWDRNAEKDFAAYRIYRNGQPLAATITSPAYSDADVKASATYEYRVSAVDTAGNESPLSGPVSATLP